MSEPDEDEDEDEDGDTGIQRSQQTPKDTGEDADEKKQDDDEKKQDNDEVEEKKQQYINTLNLMLNEAEEEQPFEISPENYAKFVENIQFNEHESSDDDIDLSGKSPNESTFFLSGESSNPLDPNNYLLVNKKNSHGKIRKLIMCRATAQNISAKAEEILKQYKIVNDMWKQNNADEIKRVTKAVKEARGRMKSGSEYRVLSRKYIKKKIKPIWNNWASTLATNDGGTYSIFSVYTMSIHIYIYIAR